MKTPQVKDYNLPLTADGLPQRHNAVGTYFICSAADQKFEMSFDGQSWFSMNQGLFFPQISFTSLWFRSVTGVATNISFYVADTSIGDSRLNIIHDANQILAVGSKIPPTYLVCSNFNLAAGANQVIAGTNAGNQRKDIIITNLDAASVLTIQNAAGGTGGIVWPQDNLPLETSDTVKILNQSAAAISVLVMEVYYNA